MTFGQNAPNSSSSRSERTVDGVKPRTDPLSRGDTRLRPRHSASCGGAIVPRGGNASPYLHVNEGITSSRYTSWTTDIDVAKEYAGNNGVIFSVNSSTIPNRTIDASTFSRLPHEKEVLIEGTITVFQEYANIIYVCMEPIQRVGLGRRRATL
jgi:hypothetical protein